MAPPVMIGGPPARLLRARGFAAPIHQSAGRRRASWRPNSTTLSRARLRARESSFGLLSPAFPARESELIQAMTYAIIEDSGERKFRGQ